MAGKNQEQERLEEMRELANSFLSMRPVDGKNGGRKDNQESEEEKTVNGLKP